MAFLIIAGNTVRVTPTGASEQASFEVGSDSRAYAGNLRSTGRAEKRIFQFITPPILHTLYETIRTATINGQQVACTGDVIPGANFRVRLTRSIVKVRGGVGSKSIATITMQEV